MDTVSLVARAAYPYDGRQLKSGQRFDAAAEDARLLTLLKLAEPVSSATDPEPDEPTEMASVSGEVIHPKPKRAYRRRDLQPEP